MTKTDQRDEVDAERKKQFIRSLKYLPATRKHLKDVDPSADGVPIKEDGSLSALLYLGVFLIIGFGGFLFFRKKNEG